MAPLRRKAKDSKILISKRNRDFLFSERTQKMAEYYNCRYSKRWSIIKKLCLCDKIHTFVWQKLSRMAKRFSVLFFIQRCKLLNGEVSMRVRVTSDRQIQVLFPLREIVRQQVCDCQLQAERWSAGFGREVEMKKNGCRISFLIVKFLVDNCLIVLRARCDRL